MPVYNNLKCIFIHIPKTAGQSFHHMLSELDSTIHLDGDLELGHMTAHSVKERMTFDSYFKFSIVRHPIDRMISEFNFSKKYRPYLPKEIPTFQQFVYEVSRINLDLPHRTINHIYPQHRFLYAGDNLMVDYVGRFESLNEVVDVLSQRLGKRLNLPHINKSDKLVKKCPAKTVDLIYRLYHEDFRRFGYSLK